MNYRDLFGEKTRYMDDTSYLTTTMSEGGDARYHPYDEMGAGVSREAMDAPEDESGAAMTTGGMKRSYSGGLDWFWSGHAHSHHFYSRGGYRSVR